MSIKSKVDGWYLDEKEGFSLINHFSTNVDVVLGFFKVYKKYHPNAEFKGFILTDKGLIFTVQLLEDGTLIPIPNECEALNRQ